MTEWFEGKVEGREEVAPGLVHMRVSAPEAVLASFVQAGQFQRLSADGGASRGHFALANAPGEGALEYLLRAASGAASLGLTRLEVGQRLQLGMVEGHGFPLERTVGHPLLLVAVGSGLAPMRAVLHALERERRLSDRVSLFYGVNTPRDFPFEPELRSWEQRGLTLVRSVAVPDAAWTGRTGFVQRHLEGPALAPDTVAFLVGQKEMLQEAKALLVARGLSSENLHLNY